MKFSIDFNYDEDDDPLNINWAVMQGDDCSVSGCDSVEDFPNVLARLWENAGIGVCDDDDEYFKLPPL